MVPLRVLPPPVCHLPAERLVTSPIYICAISWLDRTRSLSPNINQARRKQETKVTPHDFEAAVPRLEVSREGNKLEAVGTVEDYAIYIKDRLSSIGDGRISISPYDTAWIALIKEDDDDNNNNNNDNNGPKFPSSLEWIAQNQLSDGSWGDKQFFSIFDRLLNTLASVVALRSWNVHSDKSDKGISFIKENVYQLENTSAERMTCGFEIVFPSLLERAQKMGIQDIPFDAPVIKQFYHTREQKLKRIPKELMHKVRTTLLFNLEGLEYLDWEKLLKLQTKCGSFHTSPSSTAFAFMETKDENCLRFIENIVENFNGGAPHSYPVDTFARLWTVDRLQRLGISRYFESEIKGCLDYVHRFWTEKGVYSAREVGMTDIDCTSMGFRLLRLHGYEVTPDVLETFRTEDKFFCHIGEIVESPTPMYSLYRASQVLFPGEKILEIANNFSFNFLQEWLARDEPLDKWVITKNLLDEIRTGLEIPWYASLPRVEARFYLEHYGAFEEIWIGKTYYRMYDVSNNEYLVLARLDFNNCQAQHQTEWTYMQKWYHTNNVQDFGISKKDLLLVYFLATSSIFEPERTKERIAWVKSQIVSKMITYFYDKETKSGVQWLALLSNFRSGINSDKKEQGHVTILLDALQQFEEGFDINIRRQLRNTWAAWLLKLHQGEVATHELDGELHATILNICAGHISNEDMLLHPVYKSLSQLTNKICNRLREYQLSKTDKDIDRDMGALIQLVLDEKSGGDINRNIRDKFLIIAKSYYYNAHIAEEKIETHISKVLFEPVE